mmetsp:Transcript_8055/g.19835  ORF Transcript_8055/g.19835 Transcript_8055/m.19835 type:complete len:340 (-) Transcript_8055:1033-2052(-)
MRASTMRSTSNQSMMWTTSAARSPSPSSTGRGLVPSTSATTWTASPLHGDAGACCKSKHRRSTCGQSAALGCGWTTCTQGGHTARRRRLSTKPAMTSARPSSSSRMDALSQPQSTSNCAAYRAASCVSGCPSSVGGTALSRTASTRGSSPTPPSQPFGQSWKPNARTSSTSFCRATSLPCFHNNQRDRQGGGGWGAAKAQGGRLAGKPSSSPNKSQPRSHQISSPQGHHPRKIRRASPRTPWACCQRRGRKSHLARQALATCHFRPHPAARQGLATCRHSRQEYQETCQSLPPRNWRLSSSSSRRRVPPLSASSTWRTFPLSTHLGETTPWQPLEPFSA